MEEIKVTYVTFSDFIEDEDEEPQIQWDLCDYESESGIVTFNNNIGLKIKPKMQEKFENIREIHFDPSYSIESFAKETFSSFSNLESINIPKKVKSIGFRCFSGCKKLKTVIFDSNSELLKICNSAFFECESLGHVELPDSLQTIEREAFSSSGLISIDLGRSSCQKIEYGAFECCEMLESAILPKEIKEIPASLLACCDKLTSVIIENSNIELIDKNAFRICPSLRSIKFPSTLKEIHDCAFEEAGLIEIELNDSLLEVGIASFHKCKFLEKVHISKKLKILRLEAFNSCINLKNVTFDDDSELEVIESSCFYDTDLETISLPTSVRSIGTEAFYKTNLRQININELKNLERIDDHAFDSKIEEVTLPPNIKLIERTSFSLTTHINFNNCRYLVLSSSGVLFHRSMKRIIFYLPALRHFIIPESVTFIDLAVFNHSPLEFLHIPSSVEKIMQSPCTRSKSLKRITFSKDSRLKEIGNDSFNYSTMTHISIPSSVETIHNTAFKGCRATRINLPVDFRINKLESLIFYECFIDQIDIPSSVRVIENYAFDFCSNLEVIRFKKDSELRKIIQNAFRYCFSIRSVNLANCKHLETVEPYAFDPDVFESLGIRPFVHMKIDELGELLDYDHDVCNVDIGEDVVKIGKGLFAKSCLNYVSFENAKSLRAIGKFSFAMSRIEKVYNRITFPASLELIEEYAFYRFGNLKKISFCKGSKLRRIGKFAFAYCERLEKIKIPKEVFIGKNAFLYCGGEIKSPNIIWGEEEDEINFDDLFGFKAL